MIDWDKVNALLLSDSLKTLSYSESETGKSIMMSFSHTDENAHGQTARSNDSDEPTMTRNLEPTDPASPEFRAARLRLQMMYAHTGAQPSDEDVLGYMASEGLI
jgi:hypothetical protein